MFGWFKRKKSASAMDELIVGMYGNPPPKKSAVLDTAIQLAHHDLLGGIVSEGEVRNIATSLNNGPIPYSTHDLAVSTALNIFKQPDKIPHLRLAQLSARLLALEWAKEQKLNVMLLNVFEETLYKLYRP